MEKTFLELTNELKETTGFYQHEIVTLMKDEIGINAQCIKPPMGVEETEEFLAKAILTLIKDGWTAIPF
jgi:hypothetical protein